MKICLSHVYRNFSIGCAVSYVILYAVPKRACHWQQQLYAFHCGLLHWSSLPCFCCAAWRCTDGACHWQHHQYSVAWRGGGKVEGIGGAGRGGMHKAAAGACSISPRLHRMRPVSVTLVAPWLLARAETALATYSVHRRLPWVDHTKEICQKNVENITLNKKDKTDLLSSIIGKTHQFSHKTPSACVPLKFMWKIHVKFKWCRSW